MRVPRYFSVQIITAQNQHCYLTKIYILVHDIRCVGSHAETTAVYEPNLYHFHYLLPLEMAYISIARGSGRPRNALLLAWIAAV